MNRGAIVVRENLAMTVIGGHDHAGVAQHVVDSAGGVEHPAERTIDTLDHRQRRMRTDLVTAVVVVGEVRDREVRERLVLRDLQQQLARRRIVHPEAVEQAANVVQRLAAQRARRDEVAEAQRGRPLDDFRPLHARQQRQQRRKLDGVFVRPLEDQIVEARRGSASALDLLQAASARSADRR